MQIFKSGKARVYLSAVLLVLSMFSTFADAQLIRGAGRGGITVSFGSLDLLIPETALNSIGLLDLDYYRSMPVEDIVGIIPPGYPMVQGVPDDCFVPLGTDEPFEDDPCYYLFYENESTLSFTGSTVSYFANAIQNTTWRIYESGVAFNSEDVAPLFEFDSSHTTVGGIDPSSNNPFANILEFEAAMPDIAPGEYQLVVEMEQIAPEGYFFYSASTFFDAEFCVEIGEDVKEEVCSLYGTSNGTTFTRFALDRLVIEQVNAPATLSILCLALMMIGRRRTSLYRY